MFKKVLGNKRGSLEGIIISLMLLLLGTCMIKFLFNIGLITTSESMKSVNDMSVSRTLE